MYEENMIRLASDDKGDKVSKSKKGGGTVAIINLMKEVLDFSDVIKACADAQDLTENKQVMDECLKNLEGFYTKLVDIARGAMNSNQGQGQVSAQTPIESGASEQETGASDFLSNVSDAKKPTVSMPASPSIPSMNLR